MTLALGAPSGGVSLGARISATLTIVDDDARPAPVQSVLFEREAVDQSDLYLVKEDGTGPVLLAGTQDNEEFAGITAGGRVIFSRAIAGGPDDLFSINADGSAKWH